MKILIFGSQGQVGYELIDKCEALGHVQAYSKTEVDFSVEGSIDNKIKQHKPNVVINAAAYTAVDRAESEPELAMQINASAVREMAQSCQAYECFLIHYSTDYVFDGTATTAYVESSPTSPLGMYGLTKYQGENYIQQHCEHYIILRTSWVYSWRGKNFVKTMLKLAESKTELNVVNDQVGCPTYAPDIAVATAKVVDNLDLAKQNSGIYHLSGNEATNWFEFAKEIFLRKGCDINVLPISSSQYPTPAKRPGYSILDNTKIETIFSIRMPGFSDSLDVCLSNINQSS